MILKRWCLIASVPIVANLVITAPLVSAELPRAFRQQNGLQDYVPPKWFLKGYFIAREKNPGYVFGPVQDFVRALGEKVPINDVMRCLMYAHSYQDLMLACSTFKTLPVQTRALLAQLDFNEAERSCPRNLPIGRMMEEATNLLA